MTNFPTVCVCGSIQRHFQRQQEGFYEILSKCVLPEKVKSDSLALETDIGWNATKGLETSILKLLNNAE